MTRQYLAFAILGILGILYVGSMTAFLVGCIDKSEFTLAVAAISGPQALGATVIGFYYGKSKNGATE